MQLHTTGIKYTTNTKVKKVKSKRDLNDGVEQDPPQRTATFSSSTTPAQRSKPPIVRSVSFADRQPGIHRGSILPLETTAAIQSTDLLMADGVRDKNDRRKLKRTASERKAIKKGKGKGGKEEKETEWIYEEKELKIAICCVIS